MFTVIPVTGQEQIPREQAGRIAGWLPAVGALLAAVSAGGLLAVEAGGHSGPRRLLAATVAVAILALLTGGLHLDGLADTADGLGSRRPREEALEVMRRSDAGPMGVAALVLTVLVQITSLATLPAGWPAAAALGTAVITGRVAVLSATGLPAARPNGFGAVVAGATTRRARVTGAVILLGAVTAAGAAIGGPALAARCLTAVVVGLFAAAWLGRVARRRLGGMTGDVFGAMIELSAAAVLLVFAVYP